MPRKRRSYTQEFKDAAVELVLGEGLSIAQAARDLGAASSLLGKWVQLARDEQKPETLTRAEGDELAYELAIKPALSACGYRPRRVDDDDAAVTNRTDDEIVRQIRRSALLIADVSGDRSGVYYEAGLAEGLRAAQGEPIDVVWSNDLRTLDDGVPRTEHYLFVDMCLHGADDSSPRAVVHLHGGHVPAAVDGYPEG